MTTNEYKVCFWHDGNVLEVDSTVVQLCGCTKNEQIVHFKRVNIMVCELYLNFWKGKSEFYHRCKSCVGG